MTWLRTDARWTLLIGFAGSLWVLALAESESASTAGKVRFAALALAFLALVVLPDNRARLILTWLVLGASIGCVGLGLFGVGPLVLIPIVSILIYFGVSRPFPESSEMWTFTATTLLGMVVMIPLV